MARIFLSYARSDGAAFARELRAKLEAHGLSVWQDLTDIHPGANWWAEIRAAVSEVEYVVLVMTPRALESEVVTREWRLACTEGKCVIPVIGPGVDLAKVPRWMLKADFVDTSVPEKMTRFLHRLESKCVTARVPFMADPLPAHFVARLEEFGKLKTMLLDPRKNRPISTTAAIKGTGGFGKTTLATAVCHDEDILEEFSDGILWVTLGKDPGDLSSKVAGLVQTLTGQTLAFTDLNAASTRLGALLDNRDALLVMDDVWRAEHARPFLKGGSRCVRLITTRDSATLPDECGKVDVDAMRTEEAAELLGKGLPAADFADLASRLGEWPLLLKLVNGVLLRRTRDSKQPIEDAMRYVRSGLDRKGLGFEDREGLISHGIELSQQQLGAADRARFDRLAIFREDRPVPLEVLGWLWGDEFEAEQLSQRLFELSLVLDLNLQSRELLLHDVLRAWLREKNRDSLVSWNATLVDVSPPLWTERPYHLKEAGRVEELRALLFNFDWIKNKLVITGFLALLLDFDYLGDSAAKLVQQAIRLSAHILSRDANQLASQLVGRLLDREEPEIRGLLDQARGWRGAAWLCPQTQSLTPPGGSMVCTIQAHEYWVGALAMLQDNKRALSGSYPGSIKLWDIESGQELRSWSLGSDSVEAISPDGSRALSVTLDGVLLLWDLNATNLIRSIPTGAPVRACAISPDAHNVVCTSDDTLSIWDLDQGIGVCHVKHTGSLAVAFTPEGQVVTGAYNDIEFWDIYSCTRLSVISGHSGQITALAINSEGSTLISGDSFGILKVWSLETKKELYTLPSRGASIFSLSISSERKRITSGLSDGRILSWDLGGVRAIQPSRPYVTQISQIAIAQDRQTALSLSLGSELKLWDLESFQATRSWICFYPATLAITLDKSQGVALRNGNGLFSTWSLTSRFLKAPSPALINLNRELQLRRMPAPYCLRATSSLHMSGILKRASFAHLRNRQTQWKHLRLHPMGIEA